MMLCTPEEWRQQGDFTRHRGHRIFYRMDGSGPVLLLLHGFPTASWDWHKIWDDLTARYQVIAPDFIGFGFSDKPVAYSYSMFDQADLVEGLLLHLGIQEYHILAHDVGDTVAQELLARQQEGATSVIKSTCLLNGGLFPETHRPTGTQKLLLGPFGFLGARLMSAKKFGKAFSLIFGENSKPSEEELLHFYGLIECNGGDKIMHKLIRYIPERRQNRERWLSALRNSESPVMLIDGLDDPVSGAHMVARYRELISHPRVVELPGVGHYPHMEADRQVLKAYGQFRDANPTVAG